MGSQISNDRRQPMPPPEPTAEFPARFSPFDKFEFSVEPPPIAGLKPTTEIRTKAKRAVAEITYAENTKKGLEKWHREVEEKIVLARRQERTNPLSLGQKWVLAIEEHRAGNAINYLDSYLSIHKSPTKGQGSYSTVDLLGRGMRLEENGNIVPAAETYAEALKNYVPLGKFKYQAITTAQQDRIIELGNKPWFRAMNSQWQGYLVNFTMTAAPQAQKVFDHIANSANMDQLNPVQRMKMFHLVEAMKHDGAEHIANMLNTNLNRINKTVLLDTDFQNQRALIDQLFDTYVRGVDPELNISTPEALNALVEELDAYWEVDQGNKGTCTVTVLQHFLCENFPAEAARLSAGLLSAKKQVAMKDGNILERVPGTTKNDRSGRSITERAFQPAAMEYGNGSELRYHNDLDLHFITKDGKLKGGGLTGDEVVRLCESIFRTKFELQGPSLLGKSAEKIIDNVRERLEQAPKLGKPAFTMTGVRWRDDNGGKHSYHAIRITRITRDPNGDTSKEKVFFRNPWGKTDRPNGSTLKNPPVTVVDNSTGEYSMSRKEFEDRLSWTLAPESNERLRSVKEALWPKANTLR